MSFGGTRIDNSIDTRLAFSLLAVAAFHAAERLVACEENRVSRVANWKDADRGPVYSKRDLYSE